MLLYGASGHAKVICSALESSGINIIGIFDDNLNIIKLDNYKVIGLYNAYLFSDDKIIIAIGNNSIRKKVACTIKHEFGNAIHSKSIVDNLTNIGAGTVILHNALIQRGTVIGKHCIINSSSSIDHDCKIDDFVHISPGSTLCGNVEIGEGTQIGAGSTVIQNLKIGKWCTIGAGSVVINNVPDYSVVVGVPGKIIKNINK